MISAIAAPAVLIIIASVIGVVAVAAVLAAVFKNRSDLFGGLTAKDLAYAVKRAREAEDNPEPRTVFGATSLYLPRIVADFADYHNEEAITSLKKAVFEYLEIKYEGRESFTAGKVEEGLERLVDRQPGHSVTEEKIHAVAISNYRKSNEYATVTYQASVGYRLDGKPVEERYAAEYTYKLIENDVPAKSLVCPQCGGTYESTAQKKCPFCGSPVIRDTFMSWRFTSIEPS